MVERLRQMRAALLVSGVVLSLVVVLSVGAVGAAAPSGQAAKRKTIDATQYVYLHLVKKKGAILKEAGTATGTLPGKVNARFDTSKTIVVTGRVKFRPYSGGSITVRVVGNPTSLGKITNFAGTLTVLRGTGKYANATGRGTFNGTVNRETWAVNVTAKAKLSY